MTRILAAMQTWSVQSSEVLTSCLTLLHDLAQVISRLTLLARSPRLP
jgi:hypothetical protein